MSIIVRTALLGLSVLIASASTGTATAVETDAAAWNQQEVTALAASFEQAVDDLVDKAQIEKGQGDKGATQRADIYLLVEDLKSLNRHSRQLSTQLGKGLGRAETDALFRRMMSIVRDIRAQREEKMPLLENSGDEIERARGILEQLARYYGEAMPPPVAAPPRR